MFVETLAARCEAPKGEVDAIVKPLWPQCTLKQAWAKVRNRRVLADLGADADLVDAWLAVETDGALHDEVRARFEGVPARYSHVIVDEAQDLSLLQLRAVQRRADGLTLVGDDAQRSNPLGLGLRRGADLVDGELAEMATAYRMSAEIADWLNDHARSAPPRRGRARRHPPDGHAGRRRVVRPRRAGRPARSLDERHHDRRRRGVGAQGHRVRRGRRRHERHDTVRGVPRRVPRRARARDRGLTP